MEIPVRLSSHTSGPISQPEEVLQILLDSKRKLEQSYPIKLGLIVYSNPMEDDPFQFKYNAEMAVKYRDRGVCGYGVLGEGNEGELLFPISIVLHVSKQHLISLFVSFYC